MYNGQMMTNAPPSSSQKLHEIDEMKARLSSKEEECESLARKNAELEELLRYYRHLAFGKKSEKFTGCDLDDQLELFENEEDSADDDNDNDSVGDISIGAHKRKGDKGRKPIPAHYPREDRIVDLSDEEKTCHCGCLMEQIGEDVAEKLELEPVKPKVIRFRRPKYACRSCENIEENGATVRQAPQPPSIMPKAIATASLLAYLVVGKYVDGMPFYRQERALEKFDIKISRKTMSYWMVKLCEKLNPLWELLLQEIRGAPWIGMDETGFQVLKEEGRENTKKSQMWVMQSRLPKPIVVFCYSPSRSKSVPTELLNNYEGILVTDGWGSYQSYVRDSRALGNKIIHAQCLVHARRKFHDVVKALKNPKSLKRTTITAKVLLAIKEVYRIEAQMKNDGYSLEQIHKVRQEQIKPILLDIKAKVDKSVVGKTPTGKLAEAIRYFNNQWERLIVFLDHPEVPPDNQFAEQAIRPFAIGRKNWLFAGSPSGAKASAVLYSLAETANANGLNQYEYCKRLTKAIY